MHIGNQRWKEYTVKETGKSDQEINKDVKRLTERTTPNNNPLQPQPEKVIHKLVVPTQATLQHLLKFGTRRKQQQEYTTILGQARRSM